MDKKIRIADDNGPILFGPDGLPFRQDRNDIFLIGVAWRGSNVMILSNRDMIRRLEFNDKRRIADELRKVFEKDFEVLL